MPAQTLEPHLVETLRKSAWEILETMVFMTPSSVEPRAEETSTFFDEVIGLLGFTGTRSGTFVLRTNEKLARTMAAKMLMMEPEELADGDVVDAIGELTNMVGGNIKTELFQKAPLFDISVPSVYMGDDLQRRTVSDDLCFHAPFTIGDLTFSVEFLMVTKKEGGTGVQMSVVDSMGG